ncbi:hypothetical protein ACFUC1_15785 [Pedococcus sp. NPDC057267]|uniref:hypothetical protein n=1 Tax=Pedococcus sp. NPDC057267 TaxID=3346077 RepID=UPI00363F1C1D
MTTEHDQPEGDSTPSGPFWTALRVVAGDLPPPGDTTRFADPTVLIAGGIDKRVILQDQLWVDREAHAHRLTDMTAEHRQQVRDLLARVADDWLADAVAWEFIGAIHGAIRPAEAAERMTTLDALTPGWTQQEPDPVSRTVLVW